MWPLLAMFALASFSCRQAQTVAPRHIFVDGGAHLGETVEHFLRSPLHARHDWEIVAFEANPELIPRIPKRPRLTVLDRAIWVHDGGVEFYVGADSLSSSVHGHKKTGRLSRTPIRVPSVNFGRWLQGQFLRGDYVLVKLDIEGAEYEVLDQMLRDGTIDWIDELYVEFHNGKVGVSTEEDGRLVREARGRGIRVKVGPETEAPGDWFER